MTISHILSLTFSNILKHSIIYFVTSTKIPYHTSYFTSYFAQSHIITPPTPLHQVRLREEAEEAERMRKEARDRRLAEGVARRKRLRAHLLEVKSGRRELFYHHLPERIVLSPFTMSYVL